MLDLRKNEIMLSLIPDSAYENDPGSGRLPKQATAQAVRESVHVTFRQ